VRDEGVEEKTGGIPFGWWGGLDGWEGGVRGKGGKGGKGGRDGGGE